MKRSFTWIYILYEENCVLIHSPILKQEWSLIRVVFCEFIWVPLHIHKRKRAREREREKESNGLLSTYTMWYTKIMYT